MQPWDVSRSSVSPAAVLLARCVSRQVLSQKEIDSASSGLGPAFSPTLHQAEQRIRRQRRLQQLQLDVDLLRTEKDGADATHAFYLTRRFQMLQMFCFHLQDVLKDQNRLRQRLLRPLGRSDLPVRAQLHRSVVDVVALLLDFMETLEEKLEAVRCSPASRDRLAQLNSSLAQLLTHVSEVDALSMQLLHGAT